jgi:hypothetical protein
MDIFLYVRMSTPFSEGLASLTLSRGMFGAAVFLLFFFVVPSDGEPFDPEGTFDYIGAYLGTGGLILFNFVWK